LQPPLPLQEFWPWQACFSFALAASNETPGFTVETAVIWTFLFGFARPRSGTTPPEVDQIGAESAFESGFAD
jgi:hypothetical protein